MFKIEFNGSELVFITALTFKNCVGHKVQYSNEVPVSNIHISPKKKNITLAITI